MFNTTANIVKRDHIIWKAKLSVVIHFPPLPFQRKKDNAKDFKCIPNLWLETKFFDDNLVCHWFFGHILGN